MQDIVNNFKNQIKTIDEEFIYLLSRRNEAVKQLESLGASYDFDSSKENLILECRDKGVDFDKLKDFYSVINK